MFEKVSKGLSSKSIALASALVLGEAGLPSFPKEARGGQINNITDFYDDSHQLALDPRYRWAAAVQRTDTVNGLTYASAVLIAPDRFITAGHVTPRNGSTAASLNELVFGSNYNTSTDRYNVTHTERFPGYVFGNTNTIDLGIGYLDRFVEGFDTPVTFASPILGEILTMAEYGNFGDVTTGELSSLGDKLAVRAPVDNSAASPYPSGIYFDTRFSRLSSDPLNGRGMNFSSGAPVYNINGDLVGLHIAGTNGLGGGFDTNLNLMDPTVQAFLEPLIRDSWDRYNATVPEPSSLILASIGAAAAGVAASARRRN